MWNPIFRRQPRQHQIRAGAREVAHAHRCDAKRDGGFDAEMSGSNPAAPVNGQPNVCWIIRWPSKAVRDEQFGAIMSQPEWRDIWKKHPNSNAYLQMNVRFMQRID